VIVRELLAKLGLEFEGQQFLKAELAFEGIKRAAEFAKDKIKEMGEALVEIVTETAHQAHEFELLSQKTGESVEKVQEWDSIAKKSGTTVDTVAHSMGILGRTLLAARKGGDEAVEGFSDLGISLSEIKDKSPDEALRIIADAFAKLPPGLDRNAKLMKVMGRGAEEMIPVLIGGSKRLNEIAEGAHIFGKVMDEETIEAGADLYQTLQSLQGIIPALTKVLAGPLLEPLAEVAHEVLNWAKANASVIKSKIHDFALGLVKTVKTLASVLAAVAKGMKAIAVVIGTYLVLSLVAANGGLLQMLVNWTLNTAAAIAYGAVSVAAAAKSAVAWLASVAPLVLMTVIIAALILMAQDVWGFFNGYDSAIGRFGPKWTKFLDEWTKVKVDDPWWLVALKKAIEIVTDLQGAWEKLERAWRQPGSFLHDVIRGSFQDRLGLFKEESPGAAGLVPGGGGSVSSAADANFTTTGGRASKVSVQMPITIHAAPGMDEETLSSHVSNKVEQVLQSRLSDVNASFTPP
jgi:hypothetical protein